jgi:hypothetical protein
MVGLERRWIMGWWQRGDGVIGDSVVDYLDTLKDTLGCIVWQSPSDVPDEIRERIAQFYWQELNRGPTDVDLRELLDFIKVGE